MNSEHYNHHKGSEGKHRLGPKQANNKKSKPSIVRNGLGKIFCKNKIKALHFMMSIIQPGKMVVGGRRQTTDTEKVFIYLLIKQMRILPPGITLSHCETVSLIFSPFCCRRFLFTAISVITRKESSCDLVAAMWQFFFSFLSSLKAQQLTFGAGSNG